MDFLVDSFRKLIIDKNDLDDFNLLCDKINNIKLEENKQILEENKNAVEIKKLVFNFFEVLMKKERCSVKNDTFPKFIF